MSDLSDRRPHPSQSNYPLDHVFPIAVRFLHNSYLTCDGNSACNTYERAINIPSTELLIKLAEVFDVSLDYLAFEAEGKPAKLNIQDRELLRRFESIDKLSEHDKNLAKEFLDLLILKNQFQALAT